MQLFFTGLVEFPAKAWYDLLWVEACVGSYSHRHGSAYCHWQHDDLCLSCTPSVFCLLEDMDDLWGLK
jgi:hypothetical protein